jgi:hypothetical protein
LVKKIGTVRINDSARFPAKVYGYPPKSAQFPEDLIGLSTQSLMDIENIPVQQKVRSRPVDLKKYDNRFHDRAKNGFEYWSKDKREPENNKPKGKYV